MKAQPDEAQLFLYTYDFVETGCAVSRLDDADGRGESLGQGVAISGDRIILGPCVGDAACPEITVARNHDRLPYAPSIHDLEACGQLVSRIGIDLVSCGLVDRAAESAEGASHMMVDVEHFEVYGQFGSPWQQASLSPQSTLFKLYTRRHAQPRSDP